MNFPPPPASIIGSITTGIFLNLSRNFDADSTILFEEIAPIFMPDILKFS